MRNFFQPILFIAIVLAIAGQSYKPLVALLGLAWLTLASYKAWRALTAEATAVEEPVAGAAAAGIDRRFVAPAHPEPADVPASSHIPLDGQLSRWDEVGLWLGSLWAFVSGVRVVYLWPDGLLESTSNFYTWAFSLLIATAVVVISAWFRRREKHVFVVWRLLRDHPELDVAQLIRDSHLSRSSLQRAVRYLNSSGRAHVEWDADRDRIYDARLKVNLDVAHHCASCGSSSSFRWNVSTDKLPDCPYCNAPLPPESTHQEHQHRVAEIRHQNQLAAHQAEANRAAVRPCSELLCLVLFFLYWPTLLFYLSRYVPSVLAYLNNMAGSAGTTHDGWSFEGFVGSVAGLTRSPVSDGDDQDGRSGSEGGDQE